MHHHRIVFGQTMEPGLGVARAWAGGGGADRLKAETGVVKQHGHLAVLVEAGGQAERVGEVDSHHIRLQNGIGVVEHHALGKQQWRHVFGHGAKFDHLIMRFIGAMVEHEVRLDDVLIAKSEQVSGGFVDGVVPKAFRNVSHIAHCLTFQQIVTSMVFLFFKFVFLGSPL